MEFFEKLSNWFEKLSESMQVSNDDNSVETVEEPHYVDPLHNPLLDNWFKEYSAHYQAFKEECIREYRNFHYVDTAFAAYYNSPINNRDYDLLDNIPADLKDSKYYRTMLVELFDKTIGRCAEGLKNGTMNTANVYRHIADLIPFEELKSMELESNLTHKDYFSSEMKAARSVLDPNASIEEQLNNILKEGLSENTMSLVGIWENIEHAMTDKIVTGHHMTDDQADTFLVFHSMFSGLEARYFDDLKRMLLYLALEENRGILNWGSTLMLGKLAQIAFGITCKMEDGEIELFPCVDALIADAIRNTKSGNLEEFNESFKGWIYSAIGHIDDDQIKVLQGALNAIGAYSTEQILLQCIMDIGMPHTPEQEKRLAFLRENQNMLNQDLGKYTPVAEAKVISDSDDAQDEKVLVYDHRFHNWSTNDVEKYFKGLTLADKQHTVAAVVDKWAKTVTLQGMRWDNENAAKIVEETVISEFGEGYTVSTVNAGVIIDDEIDSTPAVYIQATKDSRYPDLSLLIMGEPMTRTQIHLSILILAIPDLSAESNAKLLKRIIAVKEKHNPRLDTYIETFKSIITDRLNRWIIEMNGAQDIY